VRAIAHKATMELALPNQALSASVPLKKSTIMKVEDMKKLGVMVVFLLMKMALCRFELNLNLGTVDYKNNYKYNQLAS
jgi:hypothetical protein